MKTLKLLPLAVVVSLLTGCPKEHQGDNSARTGGRDAAGDIGHGAWGNESLAGAIDYIDRGGVKPEVKPDHDKPDRGHVDKPQVEKPHSHCH